MEKLREQIQKLREDAIRLAVAKHSSNENVCVEYVDFDNDEIEVGFVESSHCSCCSDDRWSNFITWEELENVDMAIESYEKQRDAKLKLERAEEAKKKRLAKEAKDAKKEIKDRKEFERLKAKYDEE